MTTPPLVAAPMLMFVVEPATPEVPILIVLVFPETVEPEPIPIVEVAVLEPNVRVVPEKVVVPENVWVKFAVVANAPFTLGRVYVLVVSALMPDSPNTALLVGVVLSAKANPVSRKSSLILLDEIEDSHAGLI